MRLAVRGQRVSRRAGRRILAVEEDSVHRLCIVSRVVEWSARVAIIWALEHISGKLMHVLIIAVRIGAAGRAEVECRLGSVVVIVICFLHRHGERSYDAQRALAVQ